MVVLAHLYVVFAYKNLIAHHPSRITSALHFTFWGSICFLPFYHYFGVRPNLLGFVLTLLVYVYLLRSVRVIAEEEKPLAPTQEPTSP